MKCGVASASSGFLSHLKSPEPYQIYRSIASFRGGWGGGCDAQGRGVSPVPGQPPSTSKPVQPARVTWDFPKMRVPYFGVLIIRILPFSGTIYGSPMIGNTDMFKASYIRKASDHASCGLGLGSCGSAYRSEVYLHGFLSHSYCLLKLCPCFQGATLCQP